MSCRPFLSHKREQAADMEVLKRELLLRGPGGWQDVEDLRFGQRFMRALKLAVRTDTGGFIWWGTEAALSSWVMCRVELPAAFRRHRRHRGYPVVPLFIDVRPGDAAIARALGRGRRGRRRAKLLADFNGLVRNGAPLDEFARGVARKYVHDVVVGHHGSLQVAVTGGRHPGGGHDLVLDWRTVLDEEGRAGPGTDLALLRQTLVDIRLAAEERGGTPRISVEPHLRLPLAALVGWEWNTVRPVDLTVRQRSAAAVIDVPATGPYDPDLWPAAAELDRGGTGPHVLAVSVGKEFGVDLDRYCDAIGATASSVLHVALAPGQILDAHGIRSLAARTARELSELRERGRDKHLLLLAPVSLAVLVGAYANGTGKTTVPSWDGDRGYGAPVVIG